MTDTATHTLPELDEVLKYSHDELIARYMKEFGFDKRFSKQVFKDLLRYLWLANWGYQQPKPVPNVMFADVMDEMWHMFLVFTDDYAAFCQKYFGRFMHHEPAGILRARAPVAVRNADSAQAVEATWRVLGPATARRWYSDYQERFPHRLLRRMQYEQATRLAKAAATEART